MRIDGVELRRIRLPLVTPFATAAGVSHEREVLLLRIVGPDAEGWGECAALAEPTYTSEYVGGADHVLRHHLVPRLLAGADVTADEVGPRLAGVKGHPMAKSAIEMAVLDAELRTEGRSLASRLGATRDRVPAGVAVGLLGSVDELVDTVARHLEAGYRRVKLKVAPGWDVEPVAALRERFGDELLLQVDANGAYRLSDSDHLARLDGFDLLLIEQPLEDDDLHGHAELATRLHTPLCLDESITSARAASEAIALGACRAINVKPGRVGGYLEARRVHDVCRRAGVAAWCGGMIETGLARAANVALAALPGFTLPGDLSASSRWFHTDVTEPFVLHDGALLVPDGPGIGVTPLPEVLEQVTATVEWLT